MIMIMILSILFKDKKAVILLNKSDLASKVSADDIKKLVDKNGYFSFCKGKLGNR